MDDNLKNKRILTYKDVKKQKIGKSDEPLVSVKQYNPKIITCQDNEEIQNYNNDNILVRSELAKKLARINDRLKDGMRLMVVCGYRHPDTQKQCFIREKTRILQQNPGVSDDKANELTHILIAVPDVAGHVVGGAVDITIVDKNNEALDMGTEVADFTQVDKIATYSESLTKEQIKNRDLLHNLMVSENFAPFYGEWWHFSYGDREWAAFYGNESAIYGEYIL
jgi:D-alanyl-D-alanine dipeptidase